MGDHLILPPDCPHSAVTEVSWHQSRPTCPLSSPPLRSRRVPLNPRRIRVREPAAARGPAIASPLRLLARIGPENHVSAALG